MKMSQGQVCSDEEYSKLAEHFVESLYLYLDIRFKMLSYEIIDNQALSCSIEAIFQKNRLLKIECKGIIGMDFVEGKPYVDCDLFIFSRSKRLILDNQQGDFIKIKYHLQENGPGQWKEIMWEKDVHGEYESLEISSEFIS